MKRLMTLPVVLALLFLAYPYLSLYLVYRSIQNGDEATLQNQVDWDAVRANFRADLSAAAAREAERNRKKLGPLGEALTSALAPAVVDSLVEAYVTPAGIIKLARSGGDLNQPPRKDEAPAQDGENEKIAITWAFFNAPADFRVSLEDPKDPALTGVSLLMSLEGPRWKITRVKLPIETLQNAAHKL